MNMIVDGNPITATEALKNNPTENMVESTAAGGKASPARLLAENAALRKPRGDDSKLARTKGGPCDNTSYLSIDEIASTTKRPRDVLLQRRTVTLIQISKTIYCPKQESSPDMCAAPAKPAIFFCKQMLLSL
ncbi:hypothetical protein [Bradyrhizobium japonicum]|uniref:hypothetical protein n=1 Tax=Bradyrhizobium japonicum TaxID=375 RepID=UPI0004BC1EB9|nr:hypothetical protein [Bradyrhizobium japonicum]